MAIKPHEIKLKLPVVYLVTGDKINSFPFYDRDNPGAGSEFLRDCADMGWPIWWDGKDFHVFVAGGQQ